MRILNWLIGWRHRRRAAVDEASAAPVVAASPLDEDSPVIHNVAERLRQQELAAGGWAAEAGALPAEAYVPEARRLVRAIVLGEAQSGPPAP